MPKPPNVTKVEIVKVDGPCPVCGSALHNPGGGVTIVLYDCNPPCKDPCCVLGHESGHAGQVPMWCQIYPKESQDYKDCNTCGAPLAQYHEAEAYCGNKDNPACMTPGNGEAGMCGGFCMKVKPKGDGTDLEGPPRIACPTIKDSPGVSCDRFIRKDPKDDRPLPGNDEIRAECQRILDKVKNKSMCKCGTFPTEDPFGNPICGNGFCDAGKTCGSVPAGPEPAAITDLFGVAPASDIGEGEKCECG